MPAYPSIRTLSPLRHARAPTHARALPREQTAHAWASRTGSAPLPPSPAGSSHHLLHSNPCTLPLALYTFNCPSAAAAPPTRAAQERLRRRGLRLGAITNGNADLAATLARDERNGSYRRRFVSSWHARRTRGSCVCVWGGRTMPSRRPGLRSRTRTNCGGGVCVAVGVAVAVGGGGVGKGCTHASWLCGGGGGRGGGRSGLPSPCRGCIFWFVCGTHKQ